MLWQAGIVVPGSPTGPIVLVCLAPCISVSTSTGRKLCGFASLPPSLNPSPPKRGEADASSASVKAPRRLLAPLGFWLSRVPSPSACVLRRPSFSSRIAFSWFRRESISLPRSRFCFSKLSIPSGKIRASKDSCCDFNLVRCQCKLAVSHG